jgi:S-adenosylmethionine-dependent methyltransferase
VIKSGTHTDGAFSA